MDINKARKLDTKYPKRVAKYLEEVHKKFEGRNLFQAMEALKTKAYTENIWTDKMEEKYNALDKLATNIMLAAEKIASTKRSGRMRGVKNWQKQG